ncbi:serine-rich hypothetical protein [Limosa lapponica baueri]|uniref:Uncharacterized protein n=1 Tax=Limosa lapponica baueri TaxID=1758121 RepID=A0A2I0URW4_LIMLA|nr:serine-rich hypothetical protein [Limosa lapponica baueri]
MVQVKTILENDECHTLIEIMSDCKISMQLGFVSVCSYEETCTLSTKAKKVQDPALGFVESHDMGPLLKPVQVQKVGISSLKCVNHTTQFDVVCKLAEGALNPTVYVIDEDVEQYWSQYGPLRDTTCHQPPSGH